MKKLVLFLLIAVSVCSTAYGQRRALARGLIKNTITIRIPRSPHIDWRFNNDPNITLRGATLNELTLHIFYPHPGRLHLGEPILPQKPQLLDNGTFFEHNRLTELGTQQRNVLISSESMSMDRGVVVSDLELYRNRLTELGTQLRNELISPVSTDMPRGFVVEEHSVAPPCQSPTNAEPATGKATGWRDGLSDAILQKLHKINPQKTKGGLFMIFGYIPFKDYEEYYSNYAA